MTKRIHPQFPDLPKGWTALGALPEKEPDQMPPEQAISDLDKDVCALISPHGSYTIDVAWEPATKSGFPLPGKYICRLIKDRNWERPKEEWHYQRTDLMRKWFFETFNRIKNMKKK